MRDSPDTGLRRALQLTRALRAAILLACLATAGLAWTTGASTIVGLALVIALEETWETSVVVAALRRHLEGTASPFHRS